MLIIAMQVSTHFHSRQRDGSNNRRPFCENPHKPVFHLMITAFVITASAFPGMDKTLSRRVTYGSPVCNVVLHVHVSLLDMHMSYCSTCACRTALHVHVKHSYILTNGLLLPDSNNEPYRGIVTRLLLSTSCAKKYTGCYIRIVQFYIPDDL